MAVDPMLEEGEIVLSEKHTLEDDDKIFQQKDKCEICAQEQFKYKCPRCFIKTCCLKCVKQHKQDTNCSGKRDKTKLVKLSEFTDANLLSDYRFLEELARATDNSGRNFKNAKQHFTKSMKILNKESKSQQINLKLAPVYSSVRKKNSTYYCFKRKQFLWHIEWNFPSLKISLVERRIPESLSIKECIENILKSESKFSQCLKRKCASPDDFCVFMKVENLPANKIRYHKFEMSKTLKENLHGKSITEFPRLIMETSDNYSHYQKLLFISESTETGITSDLFEKLFFNLCFLDAQESRKRSLPPSILVKESKITKTS